MKHRYAVAVAVLLLPYLSAFAEGNSFLFRPDGANFYVYGRGADTFLIHQDRLNSMQLDREIARLSSAKRINVASDDPSGLAVAEKMDALLRQMGQESVNDADMRNFHTYVESVIAQDQEIVKRIRDLLVRSSGGILTGEDRGYSQAEIDELLKQIDMNARYSQFNTIRVIPELTAASLGLDAIDAVHNPDASTGIADEALNKLTAKRVMQGVKSNILTFRIEGRSFRYLNLQRAESGIRDADMAEGISELLKNSALLKSRYGLILKGR